MGFDVYLEVRVNIKEQIKMWYHRLILHSAPRKDGWKSYEIQASMSYFRFLQTNSRTQIKSKFIGLVQRFADVIAGTEKCFFKFL